MKLTTCQGAAIFNLSHMKALILKCIALVVLLFFFSPEAHASRFGLMVGPAGLGIGDPNPITFVSPVEYELQYVTNSDIEFRLAITELYVGVREHFKSGAYLGLGGGIFLNAHGLGLGIYSAFGYDIFCFGICVSAEYLQTLGVNGQGLAAPYAVRLGASYAFN